KRRGFIFPSSEIYGGFSSCFDYGPLGVLLKNNVKKEWWKKMVQERADVVGLDASILMSPYVWEASGHLSAGFADPLVECKKCHKRFRKDEIKKKKCPECGGAFTKEKKFNLMMKTLVGPVEEDAATTYLRAETCQGIYVNFANVQESMRMKLPFGIAQTGKAFRNEITPGGFTFRMREFEQMEMQWFCKPLDTKKWFDFWQKERMKWYTDLGINRKNLKFHDHTKKELAHYAKAALDIEYKFEDGWKEMSGIHNRGDWDLSNHQKHSKQDLSYLDIETKKKFIPHVIETSDGADRATLVFLLDAYEEVKGGRGKDSVKDVEMVLRIDKRLAPIKAAVLPLSKKPKLSNLAKKIFKNLSKDLMCQYDETSSIGKRYRRQDEIGTPYCVTVDFDSLDDKKVTVRDRDTMKQKRVAVAELKDYLENKLNV
ncbi:MAG: glycine--tRNA ligase, partial [Patescibacteria group bacterium]|nr:glycine--tRNA ligase [Patescibacteria group bacterium]